MTSECHGLGGRTKRPGEPVGRSERRRESGEGLRVFLPAEADGPSRHLERLFGGDGPRGFGRRRMEPRRVPKPDAEIGVEPDRLFDGRARPGDVARSQKREASVEVGGCEEWVNPNGLIEGLGGRSEVAVAGKSDSQVVMDLRDVRIGGDRRPEVVQALGEPTRFAQAVGERGVGFGVLRDEGDRSPKTLNGGRRFTGAALGDSEVVVAGCLRSDPGRCLRKREQSTRP